MRHISRFAILVLLTLVPVFVQADMPPGIPWRHENVDKAFAEAKAANKPVFLYWGAAWCPPCNQVKATIFNQSAFKERAARFVPVYLDGDLPGAQKAGARFKVRGYPTMIVFAADGQEITRLPGDADKERYLAALDRALAQAHPIGQTLQAALAGQALSSEEWQFLADYPWEVDEAQWLDKSRLSASLAKLAGSVPGQEAAAPRLRLRALAAAAVQPKAADRMGASEGRETLKVILADKLQVLANLDLLNGYVQEIANYALAPQTPESASLAANWEHSLASLADAAGLSINDRLQVMASRLALAKAGGGRLPSALVDAARDSAARADSASRDRYERQSVIATAADVLIEADLLDDARKLLQAELGNSLAPYYHMLGLAAIAKKSGETSRALAWYERAYREAKGPATRLQWGVTYVGNLAELAPADDVRLRKAAAQVIQELARTDSAFYDRNRRSVERLVAKLSAWNRDGDHPAATALLGQLAGVCQRIPVADPQRKACQDAVTPAPPNTL